MTASRRILIVSNRLPVKLTERKGKFILQESEGGLATALGSIYQQNDNLWIGWPGAIVPQTRENEVSTVLEDRKLHPVFLTQKEIDHYYEGFSNEILWPLCHYFPSYVTFDPVQWEYYKSVNEKFAEAIAEVARPGDIVWIHDYQLMLLPQLVRERCPGVSVGYFHHIPFPSFELFRLLPWRTELLEGLLGADVLGFHTYDDVQHFISSCSRLTNVSTSANEVFLDNRTITVDAFPISIDFAKYERLTEHEQTLQEVKKLEKITDGKRLLISIDRLDYSKGILNRLKAYDTLLRRNPELKGEIVYIHVVVPSRDNVPKYKELKQEMDRLIGDINGRHSTLGWQPIVHFYRSLPGYLLSALYKTADVALVTPLRDGMNLVSKEYVASCTDGEGVLVLSEMAGASRELSDAILINPTDIVGFADAVYQAITMSRDEKIRRMEHMREMVAKFDINNWLGNYISRMNETETIRHMKETSLVNESVTAEILERYRNAEKRIIFLDYDGTLVNFFNKVNDAMPGKEVLDLLVGLSSDERNDIVIVSGRDHKTLDKWLGHLDVHMIAEHGAIYRRKGRNWTSPRNIDAEWKNSIYDVMDTYCRRTPGTFVEEKNFSLAWHYRQAEKELGKLRAHELMADIKHLTSDLGLNILQGNKVLEVKNIAINKGKASRRFLDDTKFDFVFAIGDDHTDEDTFKAMPASAITIKVGNSPSVARYFLRSVSDVLDLLNAMVAVGKRAEAIKG